LIVDQYHNMESMTWFMFGRIIRWFAGNKNCAKTIQEIAARAQEKETAAKVGDEQVANLLEFSLAILPH
jgi:hypothetical protein